MGEFSLWHLLIVLGVVLIFFGPSRLPNLGKSLGKAIRGFKQGMNELNEEFADEKEVQPSREALPAAKSKTRKTKTTTTAKTEVVADEGQPATISRKAVSKPSDQA